MSCVVRGVVLFFLFFSSELSACCLLLCSCGVGVWVRLGVGSNVLILLQISEICVLSIIRIIQYFRDIYRLQILLV